VAAIGHIEEQTADQGELLMAEHWCKNACGAIGYRLFKVEPPPSPSVHGHRPMSMITGHIGG